MLSALVGLVLIVAAVALTGSSSASFVARTGATGSVSAAADWVAPTVAVTAPGSPLKGTDTITATASDAGSGVASVTIQRTAAGTSDWTSVCTTSSSPYTCDWDTTQVTDGAYDLRAIAVDRAANSTTSAVVSATVANNVTVVLARPGDLLRGSVTTTTTVSGAAGLTPTVRVEYAPTGTTTWTTLCTAAASPFTCSVNTATLANGTYDLRSVAVAGSTTYTSAVVSKVVIDNLAPTVTMTDPGTPLKGTKTFTATANDTHSGIATVVIQSSTGGSWSDLCTVTTAPYSCSVDTATLPNGTYSFRAVATDKAGNTATSATVANRTVQNTTASVTLTPPSTYLRNGTVLAATATSTGTIASVKIQRSVAGANSWVDICTDTSSPYSCTFDTTQVAEGTYDLRAVATTTDGIVATSTVVTNRIVDKTPGKGVDIQTTNGGIEGKIDAGDTVVYTFSKQMDLSSIYSGWSGAATSGTMRVRAVFFGPDTLDVTAPTGLRLGTVDLGADYTFLFDATSDVSITAATVTVDGVPRTVVTMKVLSASGIQNSTPAAMVWRPASTIVDLAGNPISTAAVTESGPLDVDF
ncbi:signal peptidase I [Aeromicrobium endophyticum]|uniref:Signal peptidase I n=1 Tax=Aeromicrobium endophyticum TaxID=2292704 RepID=A0A371PDU6_9ACTN|nr:signal peptidase I [Aeromicrobium endophyticum]